MKIATINIGDKLQGKVQEDLEYPFTGTVEKIYSNSVLLTINDYDPRDEDNVAELNHKIVVKSQSLKKFKKNDSAAK